MPQGWKSSPILLYYYTLVQIALLNHQGNFFEEFHHPDPTNPHGTLHHFI